MVTSPPSFADDSCAFSDAAAGNALARTERFCLSDIPHCAFAVNANAAQSAIARQHMPNTFIDFIAILLLSPVQNPAGCSLLESHGQRTLLHPLTRHWSRIWLKQKQTRLIDRVKTWA